LAAANMDPEANPSPEQLDLERRPNRHLSFGTGIHFCLGHQLARIEGKCALEALFKRWPHLELAVPPESIRWRQRPGLRAIEKLPVVPGPRQDQPVVRPSTTWWLGIHLQSARYEDEDADAPEHIASHMHEKPRARCRAAAAAPVE
jgi:Cytochrome P450